MHPITVPYVGLLLFAGVALMLVLSVGRQRSTAGLAALALLLLAVVAWAISYALEILHFDPSVKLFWAKMRYVGIVSVPPLWMVFVLQYLGRTRWLMRRNLLLLLAGSLVTLLVVWTNELHGLLWARWTMVGPDEGQPLQLVSGPYFWFHTLASYGLILLGGLLILRHLTRTVPLHRSQARILLAGMAAPLVANFLYLSGWNPIAPYDPTPIGFILGGLLMLYGIQRFHLLDVLPIAQEHIIESMSDGVLVVDSRDRIVSVNRAALELTGKDETHFVGKALAPLFPGAELGPLPPPDASASWEMVLNGNRGQRLVEVRLLPLWRGQHRLEGRLVMLEDVTERRRAREEHEQLVSQLRSALYRTQALYRTARSIIAFDSLPTVLQSVVDGVAEALSADQVFLITLEEGTEVESPPYVRGGLSAEAAEPPTQAELREGLIGWVIHNQRLVVLPKHTTDRRESPAAAQRRTARSQGSIMVAPVSYRGATLGAMMVVNQPQQPNFEPRDGQLLMAMANQAAVAIANARLFEEVQRLAITDDLTGLHNRRHFLELADKEFRRARRIGSPLAAIMFDIDHFKHFNDNYGHSVGDEVLRSVAQLVVHNIRDVDVVGRYGGEEFAIILPDTDLATAYEVAERLRTRVENTPLDTPQGALTVTVSLGCTQATPDVPNVASLMDRADSAMYAAKAAGRNCVSIR